jgi:protein-L-isoaspartate(D-aspartate) O-methyltransferase
MLDVGFNYHLPSVLGGEMVESAAEWRAKLLAYLKEKDSFRTASVEEAFSVVPRESFLPDDIPLEKVYSDEAIPVKFNEAGMATSSSSQPILMVDMLEVLELAEGMHVLEIGAGVGYNAALIAHIVGESGAVTTVDLDPEMAGIANANLQRLGKPYSNVTVLAQDGFLGHAENAPYDRIIVTVQQWEISPHWVTQLKEGGLLELPLSLSARLWGGYIPVFRKDSDGMLRTVAHSTGGFMPMRGSIAHPAIQTNQSRPLKTPLPVRQVLPKSLQPTDPKQLNNAAVYLNSVYLPPESLALFQQDAPVFINGSFNFDLPPLPNEGDWSNLSREHRRAVMSLNALNAFLGIAAEDRLAGVSVGVPVDPDEPPDHKRNVTIIDGIQHQMFGSAYARALNGGSALDLAIFMRNEPIQGWRIGIAAEPENTALQLAKEVWQKWIAIGKPPSSELNAVAYPADQAPPPGVEGVVAHRQYYNILLTE